MEVEVQHLDVVAVPVPAYLNDTYWWAYVHPAAVYLFERQWLVNLILWGNFGALRDAALDALGQFIDGRTLQIACVYGNLTARLQERLQHDATLDVVDVLPVQLKNLANKLPSDDRVSLIQGDSAALHFADACYDGALLFFLLHEQPEEVRRRTLEEALRVVKPGGEIVIVDYHRPHPLHPLYLPMKAILSLLEPFALDLWHHDISEWLPDCRNATLEQRILFGGLYQVIKLTVGTTNTELKG